MTGRIYSWHIQIIQKPGNRSLIVTIAIFSLLSIILSITILKYWITTIRPTKIIIWERRDIIGGNDLRSKFNPNGHHGSDSLFGANPCHGPSSFRLRLRCIRELNGTIPVLTAESPWGRLGNQMSAYVILSSIAKWNNYQGLMSPTMSSFLWKYFEGISLDTLEDRPFRNTSWRKQEVPPRINDKEMLILPNSSSNVSNRIKLCCYPHSGPHFQQLRQSILEQFKFRAQIEERVKNVLAKAIEAFYPNGHRKNVTVIGVHVRRGDYVAREKDKKNGIRLPTVEYYRGAFSYFATKVKNPIYILASNDIPWCQENYGNLSTQFNIYYLNGSRENDGGLDMATLSACNHVIFGLGSFGFWAGFLNPGEVVYCADCILRPEMWGGGYDNFVLPSWKGLPWNGTGN